MRDSIAIGRWIGIALLAAFAPAQAVPALDAAPLPYPVYVACRLAGPIVVDGTLTEPAWRETSLGWGLSEAHRPNVLCPDPTLFRIGYDDTHVYVSLACYQRDLPDDVPDHLWKPRETDYMDIQAVPRHSRERGTIPPTNTAWVLLSHEGRTVTLRLQPSQAPSVSVHDALGERDLALDVDYACQGGPDDGRWTAELRAAWEALGLPAPAAGEERPLNVYREIRFFSNWAFIAWMRSWSKAEYSRYDLTERFGRILFFDTLDHAAVERAARAIAERRGPTTVFLPDRQLVLPGEGKVVRRRYAERLAQVETYANEILRDRSRIGNDLPYYPFFTEKKPREHLAYAARRIGWLRDALAAEPPWDDPAARAALIEHAIPEAREGLATYQQERLYRGLPE